MIHIARDGAQLGQFSLEQVNAMLASGQLRATDLSWKEGLSTWVTLAEMDGTRTAPAAAAPTSAGPSGISSPQPASFPSGAPSSPSSVPASTPSSSSVYAPPRASIAPTGYGGQVSPAAVLALRQTRPWVLFLAILGIVFTGLILLGGISMLAFGAFGAASTSSAGAGQMGFLAGMAIVYLLMALIYIYPIIKLFKYSGAISRLAQSNATGDLEEALRQQKSFWKFVGIFTLVIIVIYIGMILLVGVGGLAAFSGMGGSGGFTPPASPPVVVPGSP